MSTELYLLRRAIAAMRERAEAAAVSAPSPWFVSEFEIVTDDQEPIETLSVPTSALHWRDAAAQRAHVASWHPAVALAAALGMECTAEALEKRGVTAHLKPAERAWIDFARAYLGESA